MISAIVVTPDSWTHDQARAREIVVRSLVWLVSAVVSGVVRDVTLAAPASLGLSELADQSGCTLVQADREADRLAAAASGAKEARLVLLEAGYQPDPGLIDEIDAFARGNVPDELAVMLTVPATRMQRVFPERAPVVGLLMPRGLAASNQVFEKLSRIGRRRGVVLRTRARPIS